MNASIDSIVESCLPDTLAATKAELKRRLLARDNEILDRLRLLAAQQGLLPAITAYLLPSVGLGELPSPEELQLLRRQAEAERLQVLQQLGVPLPPLEEGGTDG